MHDIPHDVFIFFLKSHAHHLLIKFTRICLSSKANFLRFAWRWMHAQSSTSLEFLKIVLSQQGVELQHESPKANATTH